MKFEDQRRSMVEGQIKRRGIKTETVLNAMLKVERHMFVPEDLRHLAYRDSPLSIGQGQTISQPYMVAIMVDLLQLSPQDKVLEIGTGSGYQTAILAELSQSVYTVERIEILAENAKEILQELDYNNIYFKIGDGTEGWEGGYPLCKEFDKIIVSAAAPDVPRSLLDQLADGGILVIPTGSRYFQDLIVVEKIKDKFITTNHGGCAFVPLIGKQGWDN